MKVLGLGILLALSAASLWAQATAQIHGVVQDTSGSAIPGATVKATQTDTGLTRTIATGADGSYILSSLPLGPYQVEATKEGFATFAQTGIVLQVGSDPSIPIAMKIGAVTERVTVEANVTQVETTSLSVGSVIENQRVLDLPLNGRQPADLVVLSGAAVISSASTTGGFRGGYKMVVAGGSYFGVEYKLDGAVHDNFYDGSGMPLPFPDALQEFKISTSTQDPSGSGHAGASVNAVMKSGSNAFHGDVFEFMRNGAVNARDFFATGPDGLKRNQFGGTVGGRIIKDKLFFFAGYQGTTTRVATAANTAFVPTAAMLQGNFQPWVTAGCGGNLKAPYGQNGNAPNTVALSQLSPAAIAISKRLPAPTNDCGQVASYAIPIHQNDNEGDIRVDYQLSEKQNLFVRNMIVRQQAAIPLTLSPQNVFTANTSGQDQRMFAFTLGDTFVLSPTKVNSVRLYLDRIATDSPPTEMFGPQDVGIKNFYTYTPNYMSVNAGSAFNLGSAYGSENSFTRTTAFGANDDFRIVHGAHQFGFGAFFTRVIEWGVANAYSGGLNTIGSTTGTPLGDFLIGTESLFKQGNPNPINLSQPLFGLFAGDTWKLTSKLTATYGVNWNPFLGMNFPQGDVYNFSPADYYARVTSKVIQNAPPGFSFPGDPGFPGKSGINPRYGKFNPRIGLAWDPFGDGKTAIRFGAGMANDFVPLTLQLSTSTSPPFRLNLVNPSATGSTLDRPYDQGDPFPYTYNPKNPVWPGASVAPCLASGCPPSFLPIPRDFNTTLQYTWNLGVQRQLTPKWFLAGTYLGSHIIHAWTQVEYNPALYIPGNCVAGQYGLAAPGPCTNAGNVNQRRILNVSNIDPGQPLGSLAGLDDGGTQGYNGLLLNTSYRLNQGLNVNANYTWSHCIGLVSVVEGALNGGGNYVTQGYGQNVYPQNRNLSVGNCPEDRRQIANVSLVYRTPKYSTRLSRTFLSGWTVGSVFQARSGQPVNIVTTNTTDPTTGFGTINGSTQKANQLLTDVYAPQTSCGAPGALCVRYLNPAAFSIPAIGTAGNTGAFSVVGPGFWQWDQEFTRTFQIHESQQLEVRFEVFNVTNSFRPGNPVLSVGSPTFGQILNDAAPPLGISNPGIGSGVGGSGTNAPARVLQFAIKYAF